MTTTIQIHLYENGTLDCWVQEPGGPVVSFDPLQRPKAMTDVMGKVATKALADITTLKADLAEKATLLRAKDEEMAAKDANIQTLLAKVTPEEPTPEKV